MSTSSLSSSPTSIVHVSARRFLLLAFAALSLAVFSGCATTPVAGPHTATEPPVQTLQAGDVIHLSFPGTANFDTQQQIRRDGKINLAIVGEVQAAGKTPADLEKELTALYAPQLVSKEVKVTVVSSSYAVYVNGAVMRPGKIQPERTLTALEAIMEAGGFDYAKANTKGVVVIRNEGGKTQNFTLDLKSVLDGKPSEPFYLKANDIIYVPEKFQWF